MEVIIKKRGKGKGGKEKGKERKEKEGKGVKSLVLKSTIRKCCLSAVVYGTARNDGEPDKHRTSKYCQLSTGGDFAICNHKSRNSVR